jgi:hypothetical protein
LITGARNCGGARATIQREIQTRTTHQEAAAAARIVSNCPPDFHGPLHEMSTCTSRKSLRRKKVVVVLGLPSQINQLLEFFPTLKLMENFKIKIIYLMQFYHSKKNPKNTSKKHKPKT